METKSKCNKPDERYTWACLLCGATDKISMVPHRRITDGNIVGMVAACPACLQKLYNSELTVKTVDAPQNTVEQNEHIAQQAN